MANPKETVVKLIQSGQMTKENGQKALLLFKKYREAGKNVTIEQIIKAKNLMEAPAPEPEPILDYEEMEADEGMATAEMAAIQTVELAVEAVGGAAFYRSCPLERLVRDVRAAHFHPMQELRQYEFSGRIALGLDPVAGE